MTDTGILIRLKKHVSLFLLTIVLIACVALALKPLLLLAEPVQGKGSQPPGKGAEQKPEADEPYPMTPAIIVKFREDTQIRLRGKQFVTLGDERRSATQLDPSHIADQVSTFNQIVAAAPITDVARLFLLPEEELDQERRQAQKMSGRKLADLNLYYRLSIDPNRNPDSLLKPVDSLDIIEHAYLEPRITLAGEMNPSSMTPDLTLEQSYLNPAPQGIDAHYAWSVPGGQGEGVKVIDIETGWNFSHEDLPPPFYRVGLRLPLLRARNHGTAVLGQLVGVDNGFGVIGIANQARAGAVSWIGIGVAAAINLAAGQLSPGDVILVEVQLQGPKTQQLCACACQQFEYVPVEYYSAEFAAISHATARGIIVVEAAGNGSMNLDHPVYQGRFNRSVRDSGAILVGAGEPSTGLPTCWTNYGWRVDVHGWGEGIVTAGYGDVELNGRNEDQFYTRRFAGTSGASPMIAGAAAVIQGVRRAQGAPPLSPIHMRDLLIQTGTPQGESEKQIGSQPDLRRALEALASL
ncbi:MAG: S8 family serine peptidase [Acidobacteria bacterium]|nr:S8 family serine peptidase [Acidobacteriota bacterium]